MENDKLMGYSIEDLVMVAEIMKEEGISPEELKNYNQAFAAGVVSMKRIYEEAFGEALEEVFPEGFNSRMKN